MKKIVIAGGTGFLGSLLVEHFLAKDAEIHILSRSTYKNSNNIIYHKWDAKTLGEWTRCLEEADLVINLNGKSVDCRYTPTNKKLIYDTRIDSTRIIGQAIVLCRNPPKLWINSSSATIYRHSEDKKMDEYSGEIGDNFSEDVCKKWEAEFEAAVTPLTRKVVLRTGIVMGRNGGPFIPLKTLALLGFGGKQGNGEQFCSWLHQDDFVNAIEFIIRNEDLDGVFNLTVPEPIRNRELMSAFRKAVGRSFGLPMPKAILEVGAIIIRTETELILKSRRVVPKRLLEAGYEFNYTNAEAAFRNLVS